MAVEAMGGQVPPRTAKRFKRPDPGTPGGQAFSFDLPEPASSGSARN
jgi:hypothetical protein